MKVDKLTEMKYTLSGNKAALDELYKDGMMDFSLFDDVYKELTSDVDGWYGFYVSGDMINHFMSSHPRLKESWSQMSADERWIFVEAIHYGIESLIRRGMGFRPTIKEY